MRITFLLVAVLATVSLLGCKKPVPVPEFTEIEYFGQVSDISIFEGQVSGGLFTSDVRPTITLKTERGLVVSYGTQTAKIGDSVWIAHQNGIWNRPVVRWGGRGWYERK